MAKGNILAKAWRLGEKKTFLRPPCSLVRWRSQDSSPENSTSEPVLLTTTQTASHAIKIARSVRDIQGRIDRNEGLNDDGEEEIENDFRSSVSRSLNK